MSDPCDGVCTILTWKSRFFSNLHSSFSKFVKCSTLDVQLFTEIMYTTFAAVSCRGTLQLFLIGRVSTVCDTATSRCRMCEYCLWWYSNKPMYPTQRGCQLREDIIALVDFWRGMHSDKKYLRTTDVGGNFCFFFVLCLYYCNNTATFQRLLNCAVQQCSAFSLESHYSESQTADQLVTHQLQTPYCLFTDSFFWKYFIVFKIAFYLYPIVLYFSFFFNFADTTFSALTLLVGWKEGHPACKKTGCWYATVGSFAHLRLLLVSLPPVLSLAALKSRTVWYSVTGLHKLPWNTGH